MITFQSKGIARTALSACVLLTLTEVVWAQPSPPPSEDLVQRVEAASCGDRQKTPPEQVPVTLSAITPESVGLRISGKSKLTWQWGLHVSSGDRRVAKVTGLFLDGDSGLVATTANRDWLAFDLEHTTLEGIKTVGVAPMRGAPGRPSAPTRLYKWNLVAFPDQGVVERFALKCSFAAEGVPMLDIAGRPSLSAMTNAAYEYMALAGNDGDAVKTALVDTHERQTVSLKEGELPSLPGFRLVALSNPARIIPLILALWGSSHSGDARLQQILVVAWGDVHGPGEKSEIVDMGGFSRTPTAMASALDDSTGRIWIFLTFDTPDHGGFDIVGLTSSLRD